MKRIFNFNIVILFATLFLVMLANNSSNAQDNLYKRFVGRWVTGPLHENFLKIGDNYILVYLNIEDVDGVLFTRMESPDADAFNMPGDETTSSGDKIKIYFKPLNAYYRGTINRANNQIIGSIAFLGKTVLMGLVKVMVEPKMIK